LGVFTNRLGRNKYMPEAKQEKKVLVFTGSGEAGLLDEKRRVALPVSELRKNLDDFVASLQDILPTAEKSAGGIKLKSVSVAVGVNGKGQVGFLGTGAEVGGSATLTLNFER
jgi:hypothetical protein